MSDRPLGLMFEGPDYDTRYRDGRDLDQSNVEEDAAEQEYLSTLTEQELAAYLEESTYPIGAVFACYDCARDEGMNPFLPDKELPQRAVMATKVSGGSDPTELLGLSCGHWIM